ncbi:Bromodomain-containing protein [Aureobasidium pullulans]|uniref:Bromodomain-containing protein n=1 Tax=Aureobasidium pullulans TaxID=5580 RepID=A0A4S9K0P5_AURPU|nr:Bromodomain-containing protein [Aureobasidium pullulans]
MQNLKREREDKPASESAAFDPAAKRIRTETGQSIIKDSPSDVSNKVAPNVPSRTREFDARPMKKNQKAFLIEMMKLTKKVKSAIWFLKPVDFKVLNIPYYPIIIKRPADLDLIESKLKADQYASVDGLVTDLELMFTNAFLFNGINHAASVSARRLRAYFLKQMQMCPDGEAALPAFIPLPKKQASFKPPDMRQSNSVKINAPLVSSAKESFALLPDGTPMIRRDSSAGKPKKAVSSPDTRDLPFMVSKPKSREVQIGLEFCMHILHVLYQPEHKVYVRPFLFPIDPVALNLPNYPGYFNVIKQPMDLSTIAESLKGGQYASAIEFKHGFDLMLGNCFRFNAPDHICHQQGKELEAVFGKEWSKKSTWIRKQIRRNKMAVLDVSDGDLSDDDPPSEPETKAETMTMLRSSLATMQDMVASVGKTKSETTTAKAPEPEDSDPESTLLEKIIADAQAKLVAHQEKKKLREEFEVLSKEKVELDQRITATTNEYKSRNKKLETIKQEINSVEKELEQLKTKHDEFTAKQNAVKKKSREMDQSGSKATT